MRKNLLLNVLAIGAVAVGLASCGGNSGSKELTIVHFDQAILGETQKDLGVSIGIKKGNTTLQTALNEALATISVETRNYEHVQEIENALRNSGFTIKK